METTTPGPDEHTLEPYTGITSHAEESGRGDEGGQATPSQLPTNPFEDEFDIESLAPTTVLDQYSSVPSIFTSDEDAFTVASSAYSDIFPGPSTMGLLFEELSDLLLTHKDLQPLYQEAITRMSQDKFEVHFRGFFRVFGMNLKTEARNPVQIKAAAFVRRSARQVAKRIREEVAQPCQPPEPVGRAEPSKSNTAPVVRGRQINQWLENVLALPPRQIPTQAAEQHVPEPYVPESSIPEPNIPETPEEESEEENQSDDDGDPLLLVEIKTFLTSSRAFGHLMDSIQIWLNPKANRAKNTESDPQISRESVLTVAQDHAKELREVLAATKEPTVPIGVDGI
ncbi:hypothetical protein QBC47DRAFT_389354, partial [Echria macrotheca]